MPAPNLRASEITDSKRDARAAQQHRGDAANGEQVRLGIIGFGAQGSMYAGFIQDGMVPNIEIGAICDVDPAKAQVVESKYSGVPFYDDYVAMLDSGDVDAVVTCVPQSASGNGYRGAQAEHPRTRGEACRRLHKAGQGAKRIRGDQTRTDLRHHVQPAQQSALSEAQRDRRERCTRHNPTHQLDHHHLVATAGLLRAERLASDLGWRGWWGAGQPGATPA